jgi:hypothetical protein
MVDLYPVDVDKTTKSHISCNALRFAGFLCMVDLYSADVDYLEVVCKLIDLSAWFSFYRCPINFWFTKLLCGFLWADHFLSEIES